MGNERETRTGERFMFWLALLVFGASLGAHLATFLPGRILSMHMLWPLHLLSMAPFLAAVVLLSVNRPRGPRGESGRDRRTRRRGQAIGTLKLLPMWARVVLLLGVGYAGVNFVLFIGLMEGGGPHSEGTTYYLSNHGQVIRELTLAEFQRFQTLEVRGFSGHWMVFSLAAAAILRWVLPAVRELPPAS